jgi:hypothetical protein
MDHKPLYTLIFVAHDRRFDGSQVKMGREKYIHVDAHLLDK